MTAQPPVEQAPVPATTTGEIQQHLTAMLHLLRSQDILKMSTVLSEYQRCIREMLYTLAVRLESFVGTHTRYMAIVSPGGGAEAVILGVDYAARATTIGLVLPIYASTGIRLDGDGGICVCGAAPPPQTHHVFKPISLQAMWSAFQCLHNEHTIARSHAYFPGGGTHGWVHYYASRVSQSGPFRAEWLAERHLTQFADEDLVFDIRPKTMLEMDRQRALAPERAAKEARLRALLKNIMQSVDLDNVNVKDIRGKLEEQTELGEYKQFVDREMLVILGQMETSSRIFPHLYLGTEWNAACLEELTANNVKLIVNVTNEVDNFFPGWLNYMKIPVSDEATSELLKYWDVSYRFIDRAKEDGCAVLVHCKKGISRSSSTVIAYAMKAYNWSLEEALRHVKQRRNCITPNRGFMEQLRVYEGILEASRHRDSTLWNHPPPAPSETAPAGEKTPEGLLGSADFILDPKANAQIIYSKRNEPPAGADGPSLAAAQSGNLAECAGPVSVDEGSELADECDQELMLGGVQCVWRQRHSRSLHLRDPVRSVEQHLNRHGEERLSLKDIKHMLNRSRATSGQTNSSSSGVSCSDSNSSLSDDASPPRRHAHSAKLARRNSKSSSSGSTGDSILASSPPEKPAKKPCKPPSSTCLRRVSTSPSMKHPNRSQKRTTDTTVSSDKQTSKPVDISASCDRLQKIPSLFGKIKIFGKRDSSSGTTETKSDDNLVNSGTKSGTIGNVKKWANRKSSNKSDGGATGSGCGSKMILGPITTKKVREEKERIERLSQATNADSQGIAKSLSTTSAGQADKKTAKRLMDASQNDDVVSVIFPSDSTNLGFKKPLVPTAGGVNRRYNSQTVSDDSMVRSLVGVFEAPSPRSEQGRISSSTPGPDPRTISQSNAHPGSTAWLRANNGSVSAEMVRKRPSSICEQLSVRRRVHSCAFDVTNGEAGALNDAYASSLDDLSGMRRSATVHSV